MCDKHHKPTRKGISLKEGKAHKEDHQNWSRRSFLSTIGVGGGLSMMLGNIPLSAMAPNPLQAALSGAETDKVLVIIRLKGGNDGLNTIIPLYDYSYYQNQRPTLAIPQNEIIPLTNEIGIPNFMSDLNSMWNDGHMKVLHSVGYEDQNLSHFLSSDIWASGTTEVQANKTGVFGRFFENLYPDYLVNPPDVPPAIHIGYGNNTILKGESAQVGLSVNNLGQFYEIAQTGSVYNVTDVPDCYYGEQLAFTRSISNSTYTYSEVIKDAYLASTSDVDYGSVTYSNRNLNQQLAIVARLIKGNLGTRVYLVEMDGFDTHEGQAEWHPQLMQTLSESVKLFFEDLAFTNQEDKVLGMTISEFGRRIEENGSLGTDHGSAAPILLFSGALQSNGFIGEQPNMQNTDYIGNLEFGTDFRSVYSTVLEDWLCVDPLVIDTVMDNSYARIDDMLPGCSQVVDVPTIGNEPFFHKAHYGANGEIQIRYNLPAAGKVTIELYNIGGQKIKDLKNAQETGGQQMLSFNPQKEHFPIGNYVYRILYRGQAHSGKVQFFNTK